MYEASGKEGLTFRLNSPITEEQWDAIADVDFEHTDRIWFSTKHGKEVEFVKRKKGKWLSFCRGKICNCSVCHKGYDNTYEFTYESIEEWNYCPNCGAKMER